MVVARQSTSEKRSPALGGPACAASSVVTWLGSGLGRGLGLGLGGAAAEAQVGAEAEVEGWG